MRIKTQIVHGGSDSTNGDYSWIHRLAKLKQTASRWSCGKQTLKGDKLFIYFEKPHSAIIASATAIKDAEPGGRWPYVTKIGKIKILPAPISICEMRKMFPRWKWLNYPRAKQYLDDYKAIKLSERAALNLKTCPVAIKVSGAGFGTVEENRLVEQAARSAMVNHFKKRSHQVVSREKDNLGYDFDISRDGVTLHVELKGISGSLLQFPITANEVGCARSDSMFRLVVVTEATTSRRKLHIFPRKDFLKQFELKPLAYIAAAKLDLTV